MTPTALKMELVRRDADKGRCFEWDVMDDHAETPKEGCENLLAKPSCKPKPCPPGNKIDPYFHFPPKPLSPRNLLPSPKNVAENYEDLQRRGKRQKLNRQQSATGTINNKKEVRLGREPAGLTPLLISQTYTQNPSLSPALLPMSPIHQQYLVGLSSPASHQYPGFPLSARSQTTTTTPRQFLLSSPPHDSRFADAAELSPSTNATQKPFNFNVDRENVACLNLGSEFLPRQDYCQNVGLCDCGVALCHEIGYPNEGSFTFPRGDPNFVLQWCKVLGLSDPARIREMQEHPESYRLAYWHFHPRHRVWNSVTEYWELRPETLSEALPDAYLQGFVDNWLAQNSGGGVATEQGRKPSKRMLLLHKRWVQTRRPPTLEP